MSGWLVCVIAWAFLVIGFTLGLLWAGMFPRCEDGGESECCGGACQRPGVNP